MHWYQVMWITVTHFSTGIAMSNFQEVEKSQNYSDIIIINTSNIEHMNAGLKYKHGLSVHQRISLKVWLKVHETFNCSQHNSHCYNLLRVIVTNFSVTVTNFSESLLQPSQSHCYNLLRVIVTTFSESLLQPSQSLLQPSQSHCYNLLRVIVTPFSESLLQPSQSHCYNLLSHCYNLLRVIVTTFSESLLQPSQSH